MKYLTLILVLLAGCSSQPQELKLGNEVPPPYGCVELRKNNPDAEC